MLSEEYKGRKWWWRNQRAHIHSQYKINRRIQNGTKTQELLSNFSWIIKRHKRLYFLFGSILLFKRYPFLSPKIRQICLPLNKTHNTFEFMTSYQITKRGGREKKIWPFSASKKWDPASSPSFIVRELRGQNKNAKFQSLRLNRSQNLPDLPSPPSPYHHRTRDSVAQSK